MDEDTKNLKSEARLAKQRLKHGFWSNYQNELQEKLAVAEQEGLNGSQVQRFFAGQITSRVKGEKEDNFYLKVKDLLLSEGEVSDAIGRLTDRDIFDKLSYEEKQRYTFSLSEKYLNALQRFKKESEFKFGLGGF